MCVCVCAGKETGVHVCWSQERLVSVQDVGCVDRLRRPRSSLFSVHVCVFGCVCLSVQILHPHPSDVQQMPSNHRLISLRIL